MVNRLEGTALGCAWLLDRWDDLRELLEDGLKWQAPDRFKAIRLLGKQPLEAMDDERVMMIYLACGAMDPEGKSTASRRGQRAAPRRAGAVQPAARRTET